MPPTLIFILIYKSIYIRFIFGKKSYRSLLNSNYNETTSVVGDMVVITYCRILQPSKYSFIPFTLPYLENCFTYLKTFGKDVRKCCWAVGAE